MIASENHNTSLEVMKESTAFDLGKHQNTVGDISDMEGCDLVLRLGRIGRCKIKDTLIQVGDSKVRDRGCHRGDGGPREALFCSL